MDEYSLKKSERLCRKKAFELLFNEGKFVFSYPVKIFYVQEKAIGTASVQAAFGASKRNFKRANKRNKIKRLLKESYRKHKLSKREGLNQYLMFVYVSKKIENIDTIEKSIIKGLNYIGEKYS